MANSFTKIATLPFSEGNFAFDIVKNGDTVYVNNKSGFNIVNVATPASPVILSDTGSPSGNIIAIGINDNNDTLYFLNDNNDFYCYDISDKSNPTQLGTFNVGINFTNQPGSQILAVLNATTILVYSFNSALVQAIDVTNPTIPVLIGSPINISLWGITVSSGLLYTIPPAETDIAISVYDMSNLNSPVLLGQYTGTYQVGGNMSMTVVNEIIYTLSKSMVDGLYHLLILDANDPTNIILKSDTVTTIDPTHNVSAISVSGDYLVSTDGEFDSIFLYNISDPTLPIELETNPQGGYGVVLDGDYFYLIDIGSPASLLVYQLSDNTLGKLEYRYVDADGVVTWRTLLSDLTSVNFNFTSFWNTTENLRESLFVNGQPQVQKWNGAITTYASSTTDTITKQGTDTWEDTGFYVSGNKVIVLNGIEYTYTGGETTTTLTGVTPDPTGMGIVAGDVIHQQVVTYLNSSFTSGPSATFANGLISTLNNQVFLGALNSSVVWISKVNDFTDYSSSNPRQVGEGATLILDNQIVAFKPQENFMYVSAGQDLWYNISFELQTSTVGVTYEQVNALPLKTGRQQGAFSQAFVSHMKNNIIMVTNEPTIDMMGRLENYFGTPMAKNISDPIKLDVDKYDFTDGSIFYFQYYIYVAIPKNNTVLVYNIETGSWESPQVLPISRFYIVDGELYGHSYTTSESYKLFTGYADRVYPGATGHPIDAVWKFSYQNYGSRFAYKSANYMYVEGYINQNTVATATITYELDGCATTKTFDIDGSDSQIVCITSPEGSLGKHSLGKIKLGGGKVGSIQNLPPKFRVEKSFSNTDFFECSISFEVLGIDNRMELLAFGLNIMPSTQESIQIRQ